MGVTNVDDLTVSGALTAGGDIVPSRLPVTYRGTTEGEIADETFFIADRAYTVVRIDEVHAVAGTAAAFVQVTKETGTQAPGAGTDLLTNNTSSGFSVTATANTVQNGTLTTAAGALTLAAGNRLSVDYTSAGAPLAGVVVTVLLKPS